MEWLRQIFQSWLPKDWITFGASIAALAFSFASYRQKSADSKLALRKQLTDTLKELTALNITEATYRDSAKKDSYPRNFGGLLADQRRFLTRQAASLADSLGDLANSFERQMIANAFDLIDYEEEAIRFFKSATELQQSNVDRGLALRNYGRFLFKQGNSVEAAARYNESIATFRGDNDRFRFYRGDTYVKFANEQFAFNKDRKLVTSLLEDAKKEFSGFHNEARRAKEVERVDSMIDTFSTKAEDAFKTDIGAA